jgi:hypothetical protein
MRLLGNGWFRLNLSCVLGFGHVWEGKRGRGKGERGTKLCESTSEEFSFFDPLEERICANSCKHPNPERVRESGVTELQKQFPFTLSPTPHNYFCNRINRTTLASVVINGKLLRRSLNCHSGKPIKKGVQCSPKA